MVSRNRSREFSPHSFALLSTMHEIFKYLVNKMEYQYSFTTLDKFCQKIAIFSKQIWFYYTWHDAAFEMRFDKDREEQQNVFLSRKEMWYHSNSHATAIHVRICKLVKPWDLQRGQLWNLDKKPFFRSQRWKLAWTYLAVAGILERQRSICFVEFQNEILSYQFSSNA